MVDRIFPRLILNGNDVGGEGAIFAIIEPQGYLAVINPRTGVPVYYSTHLKRDIEGNVGMRNLEFGGTIKRLWFFSAVRKRSFLLIVI